MTDEEKAEEYALKVKYNFNAPMTQIDRVIEAYLDGLAEGKPKWHNLRKNPDDLPKCAENEQIIFYVHEYYKDFEKYKNHYCLGFYKKSFMNNDVKLFVEKSKGYECEHSTEDILRWYELPKFEESE